MGKHFFYIIGIIGLIGLSSCNGFSNTESGLRYKFLKRSQNQALPNFGQYLQCYYSIQNSEDSLIYKYLSHQKPGHSAKQVTKQDAWVNMSLDKY